MFTLSPLSRSENIGACLEIIGKVRNAYWQGANLEAKIVGPTQSETSKSEHFDIHVPKLYQFIDWLGYHGGFLPESIQYYYI